MAEILKCYGRSLLPSPKRHFPSDCQGHVLVTGGVEMLSFKIRASFFHVQAGSQVRRRGQQEPLYKLAEIVNSSLRHHMSKASSIRNLSLFGLQAVSSDQPSRWAKPDCELLGSLGELHYLNFSSPSEHVSAAVGGMEVS